MRRKAFNRILKRKQGKSRN